MKKTALCGALCIGAIAALGTSTAIHAAQAETDTIEAGGAQLEFKLGYTRDDQDPLVSSSERTFPYLARIGLTRVAELRIETDSRVSMTETEAATGARTRTSGWADASLGIRWRSHDADERTGRPSIAWTLALAAPTGSSAFRGDDVATTLAAAAEWTYAGDVSLGVMPGLLHARNGARGWFVAPSAALTLGKGWTSRFRTTVELVASQLTSSANGGNEATVNLGATYAVTDMFELEAEFLRGITQSTPESSVVFGVNLRF
jgi:Putative MetA-pathway of phenol degradation